MSAHYWDNAQSRSYQYIIGYNNHATDFVVHYKRYWNSNQWTSFTADGSTTYTITDTSGFISQACWKNAKFYTGANAPSGGEEQFRASHEEWVYDSTAGKVF